MYSFYTRILRAASALSFVAALCSTPLSSLADEPFRGTYSAENFSIKLVIDLYEENINVPGMDMFGPMNGYVRGTDLYCTWYVSSVRETNERQAVVHFSNELGSETQEVVLTIKGDSLLTFRQAGGATMKKVVGKKLQKLPNEISFKRVFK